jgi:phage host-nuclease inhibitor protein Gam
MTTKLPKITTTEQAEAALGAYAFATHRLAKLEAEMNLKLTETRRKYEDEMAQLADAARAEEKRLRSWADGHPEIFGKARSVKLLHGVVGYRLGNYAVKLVRGFKLERVVALVKAAFGPAYIRQKLELDKDLILADRARLGAEALAGCGLVIEQAEKFYIEPEKSEAPE